jgi:hypothetical protein
MRERERVLCGARAQRQSVTFVTRAHPARLSVSSPSHLFPSCCHVACPVSLHLFLVLDPHISVFCSAFKKVVFLLAKSLTFFLCPESGPQVSFCQAARPPRLHLYPYSSSPFDRALSSSCLLTFTTKDPRHVELSIVSTPPTTSFCSSQHTPLSKLQPRPLFQHLSRPVPPPNQLSINSKKNVRQPEPDADARCHLGRRCSWPVPPAQHPSEHHRGQRHD